VPSRTSHRRWIWYRPVTVAAVVALFVVVTVTAAWSRASSTDPARATTPAGSEALAPLTAGSDLLDVGTRALALISYPWHDLGYEIVFAPGQPDVRAQTDTVTHRITVFLARGDAVHRVAHDIGHELGHAYDATHLTNAQRASYLEARGAQGAVWFPGDRFSDYDTGAGDFAEVFAACHAASPEFRSRLRPRPSQPCSLIPTSGSK